MVFMSRTNFVLCLVLFFFFHCTVHPRILHSFPTRRSSDLEDAPPIEALARADAVKRPHDENIDSRARGRRKDRKSTRLNSSHRTISYAVFCLKKKNNTLFGLAFTCLVSEIKFCLSVLFIFA